MGAPEKSQSNHNSSTQRVKVYRLNDDGKWDDQGTGHVTVDYVERSEDLGVFVFDEEDNETLLLHRICSDDIYRKQEDTIISWRDSEFSTELALSFQETAGCSYIWDQICSAQRNLHFNTLSNETFHRANNELRELPPVELSSLPIILKTVSESGIADQMRLIEVILNDQEFFKKLMEVFRDCEKMQNIDGLQMIFKIVRGIILLNSPQIIEKIFGDELFMDIVGSLEFDPEVHNVQHHRNFLKEHVVFKEAIPIKDPLVLSRIHQTYRVGYLKDVILPRMLDEATIANLNSIIHSNNAIVVSLLKDDSTFIQELFARLKSPTTSAESKKNLIFFLHEFCSLSKSLQMVQQLRLYRDLINEGIFDIVTDALQSPDKRLVLTGTDILILFLNQDPNLLRTYVVRQEGSPLLGLLVKGMLTDFGDDMHCQFLEILRSLLDSFTLSGSQRDTIIELFYEKHLGELIDVITSSCPEEGSTHQMSNVVVSGERVENMKIAKPEILSNICELLCFCVLHHPYRIKCNFLPNNVIGRVLFLTQRREKYLVVSSVRFIRTILTRHDENLTTHIVKHNLLKPIVGAFVANGNRYNLLNSAVLELFEYIQKENLKPLVKYLVDLFWGELAKFENLASVHCLRVKYEQYMDSDASKSTGNVMAPRKRHDERGLDKEEEDYFNEDSDGEDTSSASISNTHGVEPQTGLPNGGTTTKPSLSNPRSGGLVDYDDEDDDEDYHPPLRKHIETSKIDEGIIGPVRVKRKTIFKEKIPGLIKKQRLGKNIKSKDSVFAALCSTLADIAPRTCEENKNLSEVTHMKEEFVNDINSSDDNKSIAEERDKENGTVFSKPLSDCLHIMSDNIKISPPTMEGNENSDVEYREEETSCHKNGSDDIPSLEKETPTSRTLSACLHNKLDNTDVPITNLTVNKNSDIENHREDKIAGDRDGSDDTNNPTEDSHKEKEISISDSDKIDIASIIEETKNSDLENHEEANCLHLSPDKKQLTVEECALIPPNSSPEMAIDGS